MVCPVNNIETARACRHCGRGKICRPRGLCWTCYYTPGVKEQFPSTSKFARRGLGNFNGNAPTPDTPTDAPPGSEEKLAVLAERAKNRQSLWHPQDRPGIDMQA